VAEKLMSLFEQPFTVAGHELFVTGSVGISLFPHDGADLNMLVRNADVAMYQAKARGRNGYQFYTASMSSEGAMRLRLESLLRRAIEKGEIFLHYQPQVEIDDGRLIGVEALVRWENPELGLVSPVRFIPVAEDTGFISQLGQWVLAEACRQMVAWDRAGLRVPKIAVNVSVRQFERGSIAPTVAAALRDTGLEAERLQLEVTESVIMQSGDALECIQDLRAVGVGLAIDDFGTGYSSLAYLQTFPIDQLKLDRSFVRPLPQGGATLASDLSPVLRDVGVSAAVADVLALVLITIVISYVSIVLGELVAKRLALQRAEGTALLLAPSVDRIASASRPVIWLLSISTNAVVRLLGGDPSAQREQMSDEELRELVSTHETLTEEERRIVEDVFEAGDRQIREVMIPRTEVDFIDASMPVFKAMAFVAERPHSRYPVIRGSADDVIGFLHVRDLYAPSVNSRSARVGQLVRNSLMLPGTREVLPTLADMRREGVHLAIVVDEYGGTDGIVTLEDLVEELVGDIRDEYDPEQSVTQRLVDGEVELDGLLNLDDFAEETGVTLPDGPYETVAGYITSQLGRLPAVGDQCRVDGHLLSVVAMDSRRIDRVLVRRLPDGTAHDDTVPDEGRTDQAPADERTGSQPLNHPIPPPHA